ncbi:hypothetical protein EV714DRAFT_284748 [Schizophyllum commune]
MSFRRSLSLESVNSMRSIDTVQSFDSTDDMSSMTGGKASSNEHRAEGDCGTLANDGSSPACEPEVAIGTATAAASPPSHAVHNNGSEQEPSKAKTHPRFFLDSRTVEFVLDDGTLYRVFRYFFELHSPDFVAKHLSNDSSDPIKLTGVSGVDFDRFLSLMYPSELAGCDVKIPSEWISVLRLAIKWSFPALRARAIKELEQIGSVIDKICVAREFGGLALGEGLDTMQWLLPAFVDACTTPKWLASVSLDDAERLGASTILQVGRIREELRDAGAGKFDVAAAIVEAGLAPRMTTKISTSPKSSTSKPHPTTSPSRAMFAPLSGPVKPAASAVRARVDVAEAERAFEELVKDKPHMPTSASPPIDNITGAHDKPVPAAVPSVIASPIPVASSVRPQSSCASDGATGPAEPSTVTVSRTKWIDALLALEAYGMFNAGLAPISEPSMNPLKPSAPINDTPVARPSPSSSLEPAKNPVEPASSSGHGNPTASRAHVHELLTGEKPLSKKQKKRLWAAQLLEADRQAKYQR